MKRTGNSVEPCIARTRFVRLYIIVLLIKIIELQGRINIIERPDEIIFTNVGIPETVETVIDQDAPQEYYRNRFLAEAMVNLNMIDTIGSGIKRMFLLQKKGYFFILTESQFISILHWATPCTFRRWRLLG